MPGARRAGAVDQPIRSTKRSDRCVRNEAHHTGGFALRYCSCVCFLETGSKISNDVGAGDDELLVVASQRTNDDVP